MKISPSFSAYKKSPYRSIKHNTYFSVYDHLFSKFRNKKIVFIEPSSKKWSWKHADIESYLRPGYVCHNYKDLKRSLNNYINKKSETPNILLWKLRDPFLRIISCK